MNVFDLFAKLTLDTSDFDKQVTDASKSFDKLGGAAEDIPGDTQKAEKAVDKFTRSVEETTTETNQAETALNDAERSLRDVGKEADKAAPPIEDAADGLKNVGETSGGADGALSGLGKTITGAVTKGHLLAAAIEVAVSTIKSFAEAVWNMDESTEEFRVSMGKLDTAFETMGYSTTSARKRSASSTSSSAIPAQRSRPRSSSPALPPAQRNRRVGRRSPPVFTERLAILYP